MANNRMYLHHLPTGKELYLGKREGGGWYLPHRFKISDIEKFYADIQNSGQVQDDIVLRKESD